MPAKPVSTFINASACNIIQIYCHCAYAFYTGILVIKMIMLGTLTSIQRARKRIFISPEDLILLPNSKVQYDDPDIERVRRAHLNDLENLVPFFIIGFLYVLTDPLPALAVNLYRLIAAARIIHSAVYAFTAVPQPTRAIAFGAALLPTVYMALRVVIAFF